MRTGLRRAVLMMVSAELVGAEAGLGYFTLQASRTFRVTDMWAGILLLGVMGYVLNVVFQLAENRALRWYLAPRGHQR
jgi:ABC-type nitrate/sulfonate/bicarbonate transport system permease component